MYSIKALQEIFSESLSDQQFKQSPAELYDPVRYILSYGGKRLRPVFLLAGCDLFGGDIQAALLPAIGIELFHNFTLLHDDIMDQAPLRRGKSTVHQKWDTNIAILSGDTLFALAYQYLLECEREVLPEVMEVFTRTAIEVCEGQQWDMNFENRSDVSIDQYLEMIRLKTAVLFACSLKIGALTGGADDAGARSLYDCGMNLGIAFQLQDDLLDVYSDEDIFGKKTGGDIVANKKTFPYLKALETASSSQHERLISLFQRQTDDDTAKVSEVKEIYSQLNIREHTRDAMNDYYARALQNLESVRVDDQRKGILVSLIHEMKDRTY
ncbi:MAG TPA: polyprenyl synthetase family protein [Bacteroidales bacterium]|nr:polyprenyl synthetase family protein [Bacteroidales bacterium]